MKADALTPRNLFDGNLHYEIPVFQRPYVWDEENQWSPLWEDILRVATKVIAAGQDLDALNQVGGHFLGAIVYESKPPVVGDVTRHRVIDGQQRTTTLQVLIDAVHQVIEERGHLLMAEDLEGLVLNKSSLFKGKAERFKLWPSRGDREAFSQAMDPDPDWEGEHRIISAHDFFRGEAAAWLAGAPDADGVVPPGSEEERVLALSSTLQHRLFIVAINLTGHDDSQLIFETLNDRGTPLLKADLIKNWVFQRGEAVGADVEQWPDTHWVDFDDDWWRMEIRQGRQLRARIDIFLQYWLTMRLRDEVATDEVFRRFTQHAGPETADAERAERLLGALRKDANTFRNFAQLDDDTAEGSFYARVVETMELAATSPLLLWMLSDNHAVPTAQVALALNALESWVIRRTLLRWTMKDVNKMMVAILKALDSVPAETAGDAVRDFLSRQTADARIWPTDAAVMTGLPAVTMYGNIQQGRLRVVFKAIERHMRTSKSEDVSLPSGLEIEHIMPRGWRDHWDTDPKLSHERAVRRDQSVNTLGNLTLLTKKLNGSLSHRPWTDAEAEPLGGSGADAGKGKRSLIDKYSLLVLSKDVTSNHPDQWSDQAIEARSVQLAGHICAIWPGPAVSAAEGASPSEQPPAAEEVLSTEGQPDEVTGDAVKGTSHDLDRAMKEVYVRAKQEAGYNATAFLHMLADHGGLGTAQRLLASPTISDGFVALWERGRVDLAVENVVLRPEFASLFTADQLEIARQRLREYGFDVD